MFSSMRFLWRCLQLRRGLTASPEQVALLQTQRLRQLVRLAQERAPFFRERWRGLDPDRLTLADLPITTKAELMENFDDAVTDPSVRREDLEAFLEEPANRTRLFRGRYVAGHTSGSTGQPLLLVQEQDNIDLLFALQFARGSAFSGISPWEVGRRLLEPARLAVVTLQPGFYPSSTAYAHFPAAARRLVELQCFTPTAAALAERLRTFQPHVLIGYASLLDTFAAQAQDMRLQPTLRQVVNAGETLTSRARQRLEQAFGVPVLDSYACGECLFLSQGCPAGPGAHINADWALVEVVDEHYRPVPAGQLGKKVLVTNLANRVLPFVRYEIGDAVALSTAACPCGNRLPRIARVEGRSADLFWVGTPGAYEALPASVFKYAVDYLYSVREWQAVQRDRNHLELRLLPLPGATVDCDRAEQHLRNSLQRFGLAAPVTVAAQVVTELPPDARTQKLRRMVSLVGKPAPAEAEPVAV